jgi:tryptophan-rich sensory protein
MAWVVALLLDAAWAWLVFGRRWIGVALIDNAALWCANVGFIVLVWRPARAGNVPFAPCQVWVTFAAAGNLRIWQLNP